MTPVNRKIPTVMLMLAMFFNPMGYDIAFYMIMSVTGSYGITTGIFYLLSLSCLGLYFYFVKINPFTYIKSVIRKIFF